MSDIGENRDTTFDSIRALIAEGIVRVSEHGYDELAADGLLARAGRWCGNRGSHRRLSGLSERTLRSAASTNEGWPFGARCVRTSRRPCESGSVDYSAPARSRKMGIRIQAEAQMSNRKRTWLVHEGSCVAEAETELLEEPEGGALPKSVPSVGVSLIEAHPKLGRPHFRPGVASRGPVFRLRKGPEPEGCRRTFLSKTRIVSTMYGRLSAEVTSRPQQDTRACSVSRRLPSKAV